MAANKVYYLSTCSTCLRILKEIEIDKYDFELQDIKNEPITILQLKYLYQLAGTYEALFSKVALKYKSLGLNTQTLLEDSFKKYLLQEYTFLKRPVFIINNEIFIGNSPKNISNVKFAINKL